jgi:hypothetical protein
MWTSAHAKRLVFLVHRWTGVAACVLMALWLFSGVVMLFVGYPKLQPTERLQALPSEPWPDLPVEAALKQSQSADKVQQIMLTTIAGRPSYRLKEADGTLRWLMPARALLCRRPTTQRPCAAPRCSCPEQMECCKVARKTIAGRIPPRSIPIGLSSRS